MVKESELLKQRELAMRNDSGKKIKTLSDRLIMYRESKRTRDQGTTTSHDRANDDVSLAEIESTRL